jgi:hypothetical protein
VPASCLPVARKLTGLRHPVIHKPTGPASAGPDAWCLLVTCTSPTHTGAPINNRVQRLGVFASEQRFSRYSLRLGRADNGPRYIALENAFEKRIA